MCWKDSELGTNDGAEMTVSAPFCVSGEGIAFSDAVPARLSVGKKSALSLADVICQTNIGSHGHPFFAAGIAAPGKVFWNRMIETILNRGRCFRGAIR